MFFFLSYKIRKQEGGTDSAHGRGGISGEGWLWGRGVRGSIQCKNCVHMNVNAKIIPIETIPGMWGEGDKGERWRGEFNQA
jgi:hypothetical protein